MGVGLMLFAESRRAKGWSESGIIRFFVVRGVVLMLIEQAFEMPAWGLVAHNAMNTLGGYAGGGGHPVISIGVLFSLGASMVIWAFLLRIPSWLMLTLSVCAVAVTNWYVPGAGADSSALTSPLQVLLVLPGNAGFLHSAYPILPWLGLTGAGLAFGRFIRVDQNAAFKTAFWCGLGLSAFFVLLRIIDFGDFHHAGSGVIGFFNVTKYPPSLAYVSMTMGVNLLLLTLLHKYDSSLNKAWAKPLLAYGRTALFFYILHLYIYALVGFVTGNTLPLVALYPLWIGGLIVLYPICCWYSRFKQSTSAGSIWRFF